MLQMWPCMCCMSFGYGCALCTLGLSCLAPKMCVAEAESAAVAAIDRVNEKHRQPTGIEWRLAKTCYTSWIEIRLPPSASAAAAAGASAPAVTGQTAAAKPTTPLLDRS